MWRKSSVQRRYTDPLEASSPSGVKHFWTQFLSACKQFMKAWEQMGQLNTCSKSWMRTGEQRVKFV